MDYFGKVNTIDSPARKAFNIAPNNATDLAIATKAIYIGGAGTLSVELVGDEPGSSVTFTGISAGSLLPIRVRKVLATGTTATLLIGLA